MLMNNDLIPMHKKNILTVATDKIQKNMMILWLTMHAHLYI